MQRSWWEAIWSNDLWFAVPLIVAIALVYAATRFETLPEIFRYSLRVARWIVTFMLILLAVLVILTWFQ
ncbi:MAG: hypothetical protein NZ899_05100 [Thermoguttaceae bacterium]|nr:hypothetical protein [Thermoguttaceae bacterium]MDW8078307.1 hypothetical protein [Thermoguttaceae bacterium]